MAASTFDSREAYRRLRDGRMDESAVNAAVEILSPFVTREILQSELAHVQLRIISFVAALNVGIASIAVAVAALVT